MEALFSLFEDNASVLFALVLFYVAIKGADLTERSKVALIYALSFLVLFFGVINPYMALAETFAVLFLALEVFSSDKDLVRFFKVGYKFLDFFYRIFFEYCFGLYLLAFVWLQAAAYSGPLQTVFQVVSVLILFWAVSETVHARFSTKTITTIVHSLTELAPITDFSKYEQRRDKYEILALMEDHLFFDRKTYEHSFTCNQIVSELWKRLSLHTFKNPITQARNLLRRGYGTIEMQLVRTIGIDFGSYSRRIPRKIYEIFYSNMILNSYISQFSSENDIHQHIRVWIAQSYIENVSVKFGQNTYYPRDGKNTIFQIFNKSVDEISREEFFVWCLGLPYYEDGIGPIAIEMHASTIERLTLDRNEIDRIAEKVMNPSIL